LCHSLTNLASTFSLFDFIVDMFVCWNILTSIPHSSSLCLHVFQNTDINTHNLTRNRTTQSKWEWNTKSKSYFKSKCNNTFSNRIQWTCYWERYWRRKLW
jgi:hypothetical protein